MNSPQTLFFYASHLTPNAGIANECITSAAVRINLVFVISGRITLLSTSNILKAPSSKFDSYLVPESDLEEGALRMLEVDNRVILPEITHTRFILTAADVIHSFAIPALGVKCDA